MLLQSGLVKKVDKASRKLRKERKNRAKKVDSFSCHYGLSDLFSSSVAPKNPKLPSLLRRASRDRTIYLLSAYYREFICMFHYSLFIVVYKSPLKGQPKYRVKHPFGWKPNCIMLGIVS